MTFKFEPKKTGLAAELERLKKAQAAAATTEANEALVETAKPLTEVPKASTKPDTYIPAEACPERYRIIFDDSGSMNGDKIKDAIEGIIEFMRNCIPNQVAIAIHPMNALPQSTTLTKMSTDLPTMARSVKNLKATNFTPLFRTWRAALTEQPRATRFIIFSDGSPDPDDKSNYMHETISMAIEARTPCDCIYIEAAEAGKTTAEIAKMPGAVLLAKIAKATGGIFMIFDKTKMDFKTGFKYLTPGRRLLLTDASFRSDLEEGKVS